jgi:hypothetical protein
VERVTGGACDADVLGEAEARHLVAETLVIESARAAGLQVAKSLEPDGGLLVVFELPSPVRGGGAVCKVAVRVDPAREAFAAVDPAPGVLVAVVEWEEVAGPGPVQLVSAGALAAAATPARWRALLSGPVIDSGTG